MNKIKDKKFVDSIEVKNFLLEMLTKGNITITHEIGDRIMEDLIERMEKICQIKENYK
jgi:hypothetical protein